MDTVTFFHLQFKNGRHEKALGWHIGIDKINIEYQLISLCELQKDLPPTLDNMSNQWETRNQFATALYRLYNGIGEIQQICQSWR